MRIEDLRLELRPRKPWEAVDLGFMLVREHAGLVYAAWFATAGPLALLIILILWKHPGWSFLALWWMKPFMDRVPLLVLSQAIFGEAHSVGKVWRALPSLMKTGLVSSLSLRRFAPSRSMSLPINQLEGLKGRAFRQRWLPLRRIGGGSTWVTGVLCLFFEQVLLWGFLFMLSALMPRYGGFDLMEWIFSSPPEVLGGVRFMYLLYFLSMSVVEPFYVGAGFVLYLNRRTHLEAWDIELAFRRMAKRIATVTASMFLLAILAFAPPLQAQAATQAPVSTEADEQNQSQRPSSKAREEARKVIEGPEFGTTKENRYLRWKHKSEPRPSRQSPLLEWLGKLIAPLLKAGAITLLILFLGWILWHFRGHIGGFVWRRKRPEPMETLFGLDIRPESLPEDLPKSALALWHQGRHRDAMALLYRGSLACLVHEHHVELSPGSTEEECLRLSSQALEALAVAYFGTLTLAWQRTAYAAHPPEESQAVMLCESWNRYFYLSRRLA